MRYLELITALCLLGSIEAQVCDDVDRKACGILLANNPNMCSQTCLSKLCKKTCKMCPLNCYKCDELDSPTNCTSTEICPSSEHYCIATQSFTDTFEEKYKLGCAHKDICSTIFTKRSTTIDGACCDTDLCNGVATSNMTVHSKNQMSDNTTQTQTGTSSTCSDINGEACKLFAAADSTLKSDDCFQTVCPKTSDKCFECYFCGSSPTTELCNTTEMCEVGKECYSLETLNADAEITYRLGCMDPKVCSRLSTSASVFGKRQGDISLGVHCCTGDKCNHHHKAVTTTTTTTVPTTTPGCSHIDIHNLHHHCPQGFTSIHGSCYMKGSQRMTYSQGKVYCQALCSKLAEFNVHGDLHDVLKHLADLDKHSTHTEELAVFVGAHKSIGWHWDSDGSNVDNHLLLNTQPLTTGHCLMATYHSLVFSGLNNHFHNQEGLVAEPCSSYFAPLCQISSQK